MKRYVIQETIGAGGFGTVSRALDRLTGEAVALKRFDGAGDRWTSMYAQEPFRQSIVSEFSILAGLRHPHIVSVLDYGFDTANHPFFTMELLVQPRSLLDADRDVPFAARINLLIQLLRALAYVHRRDILHRDLKPGNVLVVDGTVHLLDFGLAAFGTTTGEQTGTIAYMAPETIRNGVHGPASDLYAVGVMIYELFTGELPFQAGDVLAVLHREPNLAPIEPTGLRPIVGQLLAKDPTVRFANAETVIAALSDLIGREVTEQPPIRESYLQAAPFVGREPEMARLTAALSASLQGHGSAILVGGESGVGKSRLLNELRTRALTAGAYVIWGQAVAGGGLPYQLWRGPLSHLAVNTDLTDFEAGVVMAVLPGVERLIGRTVVPPPPLTGEAGQQRLAQTIVALLQRFGQPVVLLLEDLQWAGESLAVLNQINRAVEMMPLLVVGSFRGEESPALPSLLPEMTVMPLERLSSDDVARLATTMIGSAGEREEVIERLQRESDGNVFYLIETIRYLAEQTGRLNRIGSETLPDAIFPRGIAESIRHRLSFVPVWARDLLALAAAAGRQIEPDLLIRASDSPPDFDTWLDACANASVLEVRENRWRFVHDKVREGLLHDLPEVECTSLHRQLARTIESTHPGDPTQAKRLTDHWLAAGETGQALRYLLTAGDFLAEQGFDLELRSLSERGLALLQPSDDAKIRVSLLNLLGAACATTDLDRAGDAYRAARDLGEAHGWHEESTTATMGLVRVYIEQSAFEAAESLLEQVRRYAETNADVRKLEECGRRMADFHFYRGAFEESLSAQQESLTLARQLDDSRLIAASLMGVAGIYGYLDRDDLAEPYVHQAIEIAQEIGALAIMADAYKSLGRIVGERGDLAGSKGYLERSAPLFESLGKYSSLGLVYHDLGIVAHLSGDLDEARQWYLKSMSLAKRIGYPRNLIDCLRSLAVLEYERRNFLGARDRMIEVVRLAAEIDYQEPLINAHDYIARASLKLGDSVTARSSLLEGLATARSLGITSMMVEMVGASVAYALFEEHWTRAAELFGLVRYHPDNQGGQFLGFDEYHALLEQELDPDALEQAIERGKTYDLAAIVQDLLAELPAPDA